MPEVEEEGILRNCENPLNLFCSICIWLAPAQFIFRSLSLIDVVVIFFVAAAAWCLEKRRDRGELIEANKKNETFIISIIQ